MNGRFLKLAVVTATTLASCIGALAQSPNPNCQRLEAQLASLDRGNNDPTRADQIRRELLDRGIILEDTKAGVRWKRK